jgi:very-short-patch-repair endonuclease
MYGFLNQLGFVKGVDFYEQYPFGSYVLDFAFIQSRKPFHGVDIETDGLLWHSSEEQKKKDNCRNYKLLKGGWITERFGETFTIEDVAAVLEKHEIKPSS